MPYEVKEKISQNLKFMPRENFQLNYVPTKRTFPRPIKIKFNKICVFEHYMTKLMVFVAM